jgi:molybdate/tungstate transport system substrate-binding protein
VLSAGSLAVVFNEAVGPAFEEETEYGYRGEFHGSNAVMRMVLDGQKRPDAVVSADAGLLRDRLRPAFSAWDAVFASNAVVVVYNPDTDVGRRLDEGQPWYEVLRSSDAEVARSDPDLDPLGYRTVQLFELAEAYYDRPGLAADLRDRLVVDPEEAHLLAAVETGDRAAAIAYKNMAVGHGLPYRSLPPELNFADPTLADHYASVTYTTEDGTTIAGSPVLYNATVLDSASQPAAGRAFVAFLLEHPDILREHGLVVTDAFPRFSGDVPTEVAG